MDSLKFIRGIWDLVFVSSAIRRQPKYLGEQVLETALGLNPTSTTLLE